MRPGRLHATEAGVWVGDEDLPIVAFVNARDLSVELVGDWRVALLDRSPVGQRQVCEAMSGDNSSCWIATRSMGGVVRVSQAAAGRSTGAGAAPPGCLAGPRHRDHTGPGLARHHTGAEVVPRHTIGSGAGDCGPVQPDAWAEGQRSGLEASLLGGWINRSTNVREPFVKGVTIESVMLEGSFPTTECVIRFRVASRGDVRFGRRIRCFDGLGAPAPQFGQADLLLMEDLQTYAVPPAGRDVTDADGVVRL